MAPIPAVAFDLTAADVVAFARYHADHAADGSPRRRPVAWGVLVVVVTAAAGVALADQWRAVRDLPPAAWVLLGPVLAVWLPVVVWYLFRRPIWACLVRRSVPRGWSEPRRVELTPSGLRLTINGEAGTIPWPAVVRVAVTPTHAFAYTDPQTGHPIPARAFPTAEDFRSFAAELSRLANGGPSARPN